MTKLEQLQELYGEYAGRFAGKEFVFGSGCPEPGLLLIGEAPGKEEVKLSRPFSGAAGKYLDGFLEAAGIERAAIYITNAIKYRLSKANPKTGRLSNRPALREEIVSSRLYLMREIEILCPKCIVTLGNVPLRAVTGEFSLNIGDRHGEASNIDIGERKCTLYPLYHPASVIYNRSLKQTCELDMQKLRSLIQF